MTTPNIHLSERAALRVGRILQKQGDTGKLLRVYISGGGCSGFQYGFDLVDQAEEDDFMVETAVPELANEGLDAVRMVVDALSYQYLEGATVDFTESLSGMHFTIDNPRAETTCGCGSSFSIKDDS